METVQPLCVLVLTLWIIVLFSTFMTQPVKCAVAVGQSYHSFVNTHRRILNLFAVFYTEMLQFLSYASGTFNRVPYI